MAANDNFRRGFHTNSLQLHALAPKQLFKGSQQPTWLFSMLFTPIVVFSWKNLYNSSYTFLVSNIFLLST